MAIKYNIGSTPNTSWTSFTSTGTTGTDEIYVRTSTATGAFSTSSDQKVSKVYYHNGSNWIEVFTTVVAPPPVTPTLGQVTGLNWGGNWNLKVTEVPLTWDSLTNATGYVVTTTNDDGIELAKTDTVTTNSATITGLTPGYTYTFSVYGTASGYNNGAASTGKKMKMGSKNVGFLNEMFVSGPFYFSNSPNCSSSRGQTMGRALARYPSDDYVGYRAISQMFVTLGYYDPGTSTAVNQINQPASASRGTFLVFDDIQYSIPVTTDPSKVWALSAGSSLQYKYPTDYPMDPPRGLVGEIGTTATFRVTTSGNGWATLNSSCNFNSDNSMAGTNLTFDGIKTTDNYRY